MVYLGFANWGTRSLISGMESLDGAVRKRREAGRQWQQRREQQEDHIGDGGIGKHDDVWDNGTARRGRGRDGCDDDDNYDGTGGRYGQYNGGCDASEDLKRP
jgi:hypothetical protein